MPAHPLPLELIRAAGVPIAAPSANRFGRTSPTTAAHVLVDLDGRIDAVLDGGATSVGVESTVLDVGAMIIYRPGAITAEMIGEVAGQVKVFEAGERDMAAEPEALPSPGVGLRHYAPRAKLVLVDVPKQGAVEQALCGAIDGYRSGDEVVGVMRPDDWNATNAQGVYEWGPWEDAEILARRLFAGLRALDDLGVTVILCPMPRNEGLGLALRDRLEKAARSK
jgi:L-threonylcarbamoyladenylate synthase